VEAIQSRNTGANPTRRPWKDRSPPGGCLLVVEWVTSLGTMLLITGVFFYTEHRFGFTLLQNLLLASGQGLVYVGGSLAADGLQKKLGRRGMLIGQYIVMGLLAAGGLAMTGAAGLVVLLLMYAATAGSSWPALESLVAGEDSRRMGANLATYNVVWASAGVVAIGCNGLLIDHWPAGVFLIPIATHAMSIVLMTINAGEFRVPGSEFRVADESHVLRERTLALWLSRIALPSTYVVIYSLMPLMAATPVIKRMGPSLGTAVCGTWMAARFGAFAILGWSNWWHSRPRLLLLAELGMLAGFLGTVVPAAVGGRLIWILGAQVLLGMAMGVIYSGSLYFGMVLSEGSTEHGGYHEALIGLGQALGPGAGAAAAWLVPQAPAMATIGAVAGIIFASVVTASVASLRLGSPAR